MARKSKKPDADEARWHICSAVKYVDHGRGMPEPRSFHHFVWDRTLMAFVVLDERLLGVVPHQFCAPIEAANAFLLRCIDPEFNKEFLANDFAGKPAEELITRGPFQLRVRRDAAFYPKHSRTPSRPILPGLSLTSENPSSHLVLFAGLRSALGKRMLTMTPEEVKAGLRG